MGCLNSKNDEERRNGYQVFRRTGGIGYFGELFASARVLSTVNPETENAINGIRLQNPNIPSAELKRLRKDRDYLRQYVLENSILPVVCRDEYSRQLLEKIITKRRDEIRNARSQRKA